MSERISTISAIIVAAEQRHREEESMFMALHQRALDLLDEKGEDENGTGGLSTRLVTQTLEEIDYRIRTFVSNEVAERNLPLGKSKEDRIIYFEWRSATRKRRPPWQVFAQLRVGVADDNFKVIHSTIDGMVFNSDQQFVEADFTSRLALVDRVLSEVFKA